MQFFLRLASPLRPLALLFAAVPALAAPALAGDYRLGDLEILDLWARPTTGKTGAAYFTIINKGTGDDALLRAEAAVAPKVQIHTMTMDGMVMRMRELDRLAVPAGQTVTAAPGGIHIMLIGLAAPLTKGDSFPMTLVFEKSGSVEVSVPVRAPDAARKESGDRDGMGSMSGESMPGMH